jgi:hypothetical protein
VPSGGGCRFFDDGGTGAGRNGNLDADATEVKLSWKLYAVASCSVTGLTCNTASMYARIDELVATL